MNYDNFFKFPIILVDVDHEERKLTEGRTDQDVDYIMGEGEVLYSDPVIRLMDMWLPTQKGVNKALDGRFTACEVTFADAGGFRVPWTKSRWKKEHSDFVNGVKERIKQDVMKALEDKGIVILGREELNNEQLKQLLENGSINIEQTDDNSEIQ